MSIHDKVKKEVEKLGYHLIATAPTKDENVVSVLAISEAKKEYVAWIYNVSMGGLHWGRYHSYYMATDKELARAYATEDWEARRHS